MQAMSTHFYNFLAPQRLCQEKLELAFDGHVFTHFALDGIFTKNVFIHDGVSLEGRCIRNKKLSVYSSKSVLVKRTLIVIHADRDTGSRRSIYKYTNFEESAKTVKTALDPLPSSKPLEEGFGVCDLANRFVIVSGGYGSSDPREEYDEEFDHSQIIAYAQVYALDTSTCKWHLLPDLNVARYKHSSTALGGSCICCLWHMSAGRILELS